MTKEERLAKVVELKKMWSQKVIKAGGCGVGSLGAKAACWIGKLLSAVAVVAMVDE